MFDLDGTLIDSRGDIAGAANHALNELGRAALSVETVCQFVGNGADYLLDCVARAAAEGPLSEDERQELGASFHSYYRANPIFHSRILPGAEMAISISGRAIALCTNKPRPLTDLVLAGLGWGDKFAAVVGGGDTQRKKPHRDALDFVGRLLGVRPNELVMIGDGPQDIGAGHAVGAHTIGVRGGFLDETLLEQARPHVILDSLDELPHYLDAEGL